MRIINASYEILDEINREDILKRIEKVSRTCYKSEDKTTDESASKLVSTLVKNGHEAMIEHISISVKFICDRGISHELVRHRLASYAQESSRYCNYSKDKFNNEITFILPCWINKYNIKVGKYKFTLKDNGITYYNNYFTSINEESWHDLEILWIRHMLWSEKTYINMINRGWTPQEARSVLPNSLKTEIVMTANLREWKHFFKLRTAMVAHPQMRELTIPLLTEFKQALPEIFGGINEK